MANKIKVLHKRSVEKGKVPSGDTLTYGEIAINYNADSPFLSIKDSNDNYRKFIDETTNDKKLSDLASVIKSEIPIEKGDAENSVVLKGEYQGYKNNAISQTSVAIGAATTAGLKGWYYSAIDFTNKKITLSDKPTYILLGTTLINGGWSSDAPNIKVDDVISLVNDSKYDLCSKVTAINGNVITVDSLPFTELVKDNGASIAVIAGQFSDGYSVYIPDRPDAGLIDFGGGAFSEGSLSKATNIASHAEGLQTHAYGQYSHTEGRENKAGYAAHAEGRGTVASGEYSHAEGYYTKSQGKKSHAEGENTQALGESAHAEGGYSVASGVNSHAEGTNTNATKEASHSEGKATKANGSFSHAEGSNSIAVGSTSHAEGESTTSEGNESHAEGFNTVSSGLRSHAEGDSTKATQQGAHSEGARTSAEGVASHAEGVDTKALGRASHAEGNLSKATGTTSHAEGESTVAEGNESHAEGFNTVSSGLRSHAEGDSTKATQQGAHSEGARTSAEGVASHAEGVDTKALGRASHAEGNYTETKNSSEHAEGKYNLSNEGETIHSVGIGTSSKRKNAHEIMQDGKHYIYGIGGYDGTNPDTNNDVATVLPNMVEITYSELVSLRNSSKLIPGQQYRITDYTTTTVQENTQSAGHQFDIIVIADDVNVLNENARATRHEGDMYFRKSDLNAWELKYCLDNDTERFAWADTTNGKGVIYSMIDEFNNECPYDFKNIQFARWELSNPVGYIKNEEGNWIQESTSFDSLKTGFYGLDSSTNVFNYGKKYKVEYTISKSPTYCYTFGKDTDYSISSDYYNNCNVIKEYYKSKNILQLNNIVFLSFSCHSNSFGNSCHSNSFGRDCAYNSFGNDCHSNSFGNGCDHNSFGNHYYHNSFGGGCHFNSFGNDCYSNGFSNGCDHNSFGNYCNSNGFSNSCSYNSFGNSCGSNSFGNSCDSNSFGNDCGSNSFGNGCYVNSFGNGCDFNSFGDDCDSNSFGNHYYHNSFGGGCHFNSFGNDCCVNSFGNDCCVNSFGNGCSYNSFRLSASTTETLLNYCQYNHFDNGCSYNVIWNSEQPTSSNNLQNINVIRGVSGTDSAYNFINIVDKNVAYEIKVAKNSSGVIKIYCEADLIE